jgi:hypothetical protein
VSIPDPVARTWLHSLFRMRKALGKFRWRLPAVSTARTVSEPGGRRFKSSLPAISSLVRSGDIGNRTFRRHGGLHP